MPSIFIIIANDPIPNTPSHVSYLYEFRKIRIDLSNSFFASFLEELRSAISPSSPRRAKRRYNVARGWKNERGGPNPEPQASNSYTNAILKWRHFITRRFENWSGNELPYLIPAQVAHRLTARGTRYFFSPFPLFTRCVTTASVTNVFDVHTNYYPCETYSNCLTLCRTCCNSLLLRLVVKIVGIDQLDFQIQFVEQLHDQSNLRERRR